MKIISTPDYESMGKRAANVISAQVILKPTSVLGLATGSTPLSTYKQLVMRYEKDDLDFSHVRTVNLDEYCGLPVNDEQSYHFYMESNLFSHINIPREKCFLPDGNADDIEFECKKYDKLISDFGGIDLQLLGIGHTGHIGFNEPGESFEQNTHRIKLEQRTIEANAKFFKSIDEVPRYAITMGIGSIMQAKKVLLVANGAGKSEILYRALFGPVTPNVPASILQFHQDLTVIATEDALSVIHHMRPDLSF